MIGERNYKDMKIGYISECDGKFKLQEGKYTRKINSRGDRVFTKFLSMPYDYDYVQENTDMIKEDNGMMLVRDPFFLDEETKAKATRWVNWANSANRSEYDPFWQE